MTLKIWFILLPFNTICPVVQHAYLKISKAFPFRKEKKKKRQHLRTRIVEV